MGENKPMFKGLLVKATQKTTTNRPPNQRNRTKLGDFIHLFQGATNQPQTTLKPTTYKQQNTTTNQKTNPKRPQKNPKNKPPKTTIFKGANRPPSNRRSPLCTLILATPAEGMADTLPTSFRWEQRATSKHPKNAWLCYVDVFLNVDWFLEWI